MSRSSLFVFGLFLSVFFMTSCEKGLVYQHNEVIKDGNWDYGSDLVYEIVAEDTTKYYELFIEVRHSTDFSFENFYTKISTVFPDGERLYDIVSIQLADNMGSWNGDCSAKNCLSSLILQDGFRFKQIGKHQIILENYSRENLKGIDAIELKLYSIEDY